MCTVSMIADHYRDKWMGPNAPGQWFPGVVGGGFPPVVPQVSRAEFDALRREVEDMKALLKRAKMYDEANNEPNCEIEEKMEFLRKVAKLVGIDLDDVVGKAVPPLPIVTGT